MFNFGHTIFWTVLQLQKSYNKNEYMVTQQFQFGEGEGSPNLQVAYHWSAFSSVLFFTNWSWQVLRRMEYRNKPISIEYACCIEELVLWVFIVMYWTVTKSVQLKSCPCQCASSLLTMDSDWSDVEVTF
jgi:hypothetical protein